MLTNELLDDLAARVDASLQNAQAADRDREAREASAAGQQLDVRLIGGADYASVLAFANNEIQKMKLERDVGRLGVAKIVRTHDEPVQEVAITRESLPDLLHPVILAVAAKRFRDGHFADAAEAALKEFNTTVKNIVKAAIGQEFDGKSLMDRAFSLGNPVIVLDDLTTESGRNVQLGYMQIAAGAMLGIRNPKTHANVTIDSVRSMHFLFLASLLMFKLDERRGPLP